ncbi:hypothetical protein D3C83_92540 [compost metagenome]
MRRLGEAPVQAGERPGEPRYFVRDDPVTEAGVGFDVLVGVDQELVNLRPEALDDPGHHRPAAQRLQPLVHAAHAASLAAGQDHPGDQG